MDLSNVNIEDTVFDGYDSCIFDIDGTIIEAFTPRGESIGAYHTTPPYTLKNINIITDINNNIIRLDAGVRDLFKWLDDNDINIGIVSRGEKEETTKEAQPTMMLLNKFDLRKYINYEIVMKRDINKADYVKPFGKTLFIDNEDANIDSVNEKGQVDVLNRESFENWTDLLKTTSSILNLRLFKIAYNNEKNLEDTIYDYYNSLLCYSTLMTKKNNGRFISPSETMQLRRIREKLPLSMQSLAEKLGCNVSVWNEDTWKKCFEELSNRIDERAE